MRTHLTDLAVRSLKETGTYYDSYTPAFGIRVGKNVKTWVVMRGKERLRTRIGYYPETTLAEARRKALVLLGSPIQKPSSIQYADALQTFLDTRSVRSRTKKEIERLLTKHFKFGTKPLVDISTGQIDAVLDKLRTTPSECLHAFRALRTFFRWTVKRRYLSHSPLEGSEPPTEEKIGDRVLSDDEIKDVWAATDDGSQFSIICRLLLVTGQRRSQAGSLRSDWLSEDGILFPASIMKANREHLLPLTPLAASLVPKGKGHLFPARGKDTPFVGYGSSKLQLDKRISEHCKKNGHSDWQKAKPWTIQSLRRTAATNWGRLEVPPHIIKCLLSHAWGGVTSRYNRFEYFAEKRDALLLWEKRVTELVSADEV